MPDEVRVFGFVAGYVTTAYKEQDPVNIKAAERMGKLHDKLKAILQWSWRERHSNVISRPNGRNDRQIPAS